MKTFLVDQKDLNGRVTTVHVEAEGWPQAEAGAEAMLASDQTLLGAEVVGVLVEEGDVDTPLI